RDQWPRTYAAMRADETSEALVQAYVRAVGRAIPREIPLPSRPATIRSAAGMEAFELALKQKLDPGGSKLEDVIAEGEVLLGKGDLTEADRRFELALTRIRDA